MFSDFVSSRIQIKNHDGKFFYIFPEKNGTNVTPSSIEDAFDLGFPVISQMNENVCYLEIQNQEYFASLNELMPILYDWAISEGYVW